MQRKRIVDLHQLGHLVLLEAHEALQRGRLLAGTAHAVHHVALLLLADEQDVEHFDFTLSTVVGRFVLATSVEPHLDTLRLDVLEDLHTVLHRVHQTGFDQLEHLPVGHLDVPRQIPAEVHHRHDALVALQLIPLVPFDRELVLAGRQRSYVPCDVVAPTDRLHPMHATSVDPHQITRTLRKPVHGNVLRVQILQRRPPRPMQVVDVVLLAQRLDAAPV